MDEPSELLPNADECFDDGGDEVATSLVKEKPSSADVSTVVLPPEKERVPKEASEAIDDASELVRAADGAGGAADALATAAACACFSRSSAAARAKS